MPDIETWTPEDDALVRKALESLRADSDTVELPDPRLVRARGEGRRRRTLLSWTAGAAAAAIVAATVGYAAMGRDGATPVPPATRTAPAPTPTTTELNDLLKTRSVLPLGEEWQRTLGLSAAPVVQAQPAYEGNLCQTLEPGTRAETQRVVADPAQPDTTLLGVQTRFTFASEAMAKAGAKTLGDGIASCAAPVGPRERTSSDAALAEGARLWSYTKDGETGWLGVAQGGTSVAWLEVLAGTPAGQAAAEPDAARLVTRALERLRAYGGPSGPKPGITTPPPRALDEDMPVVGVEPLIPSTLFVAASQWASPVLTDGKTTYAGPGDQEGSASIVQCETEEFQAGVGGRYGIVSIRAGGGDANYIGKQRVRLFEDVQAYELVQADMERLDQLIMKGCGAPEARTTAQRGQVKGTYLLTTKVTGPDASGTMYQWVGVTGQQTEGAVSTVVFHGTDDGQGFTGTAEEGFTELLRLMDLARQK
ncbi:MAG TPA: hypothetical protein VFU85_02660 [Nocardioides sp.]|nr:hypothetical protein [Nocardioides sp.]